jgi:hypothetical protein
MELLHRASGRGPGAYAKVDRHFVLEDAPGFFRAEFDHLRMVEVRTEFRIGEVEPLVRYLDSIRSAAEPALGVDWDDLLTEAARLVAQEIRSNKGFLVTTHAGVVIAESAAARRRPPWRPRLHRYPSGSPENWRPGHSLL